MAKVKPKPKPKSPFYGRWHIVSMSTWDEDYFNEEVQAFVEFEANGTGHFQFGYVRGYMARGYYRITGPWESPNVQRVEASDVKKTENALHVVEKRKEKG